MDVLLDLDLAVIKSGIERLKEDARLAEARTAQLENAIAVALAVLCKDPISRSHIASVERMLQQALESAPEPVEARQHAPS